MKFTFDKDALIKEIAIAQEIISTKNSASILSTVLLSATDNTLTIKATDIVKVNFETQIPVNVEEEGTTTVYCDKLMAILQAMPEGEIEFNMGESSEGESVTVVIKPVTKKINFQIRSMSQEKFPDFSTSNDIPYFSVPSKDIKDMIYSTSFAVSEDETRYFMNGVYFEKKESNLNMVATDGRRLSFCSKNILEGVADFPAAIVHPKILNIILKHAPEEGCIDIAIVDKMIFFKFGNYKFGAVLLEGPFPKYERVIPENQEHNFQVEKNELVSALKRVALMVDKKAGRIYFNISDGVLKISSHQMDMGSADEEIPCMYSGDTYNLALNYSYVEEPLKTIKSDRVKFEFTEEMKAITLRSEPAEDYFHIIMPMQKE